MHQRSYNWLNKVREGKPSLACREDEERFCLCGRVERKGTTTWRFFLHSTCNFGYVTHQSIYLPGFSVGHVTYPSSWTVGRGWKWTGRRRNWHQERSVCRPKKDCDASIGQIFFVRILLLVWVISRPGRMDVVGKCSEESAAKIHIRANLCVWETIYIDINTCRYCAQSCTAVANLQIQFCWESF